ncbi:hypothetical protein HGB13_03670 [bacterium]|nr:hypothetical protein [bacterium]
MVNDEKKRLDEEAKNLHRSTKASTHFLERTHLSFRDKHEWYRKWHNLRFTNFFHIIIAFTAIFALSFYLWGAYKDISYAAKIPKINAVFAGKSIGDDLKSGVFHKSNIRINKDNTIEIEDSSVKIGFIKYRAYTYDLAEWKNVSWTSDVPKDASIVYRIKTTKGDNEDLDKVEWSDYYNISGYSITDKGIPNIKSRILEVEVIIQANGGPSPKLKSLTFGYSPFNENEFLINLRDGFFSWIKNALNYVNKKEGLYSK